MLASLISNGNNGPKNSEFITILRYCRVKKCLFLQGFLECRNFGSILEDLEYTGTSLGCSTHLSTDDVQWF